MSNQFNQESNKKLQDPNSNYNYNYNYNYNLNNELEELLEKVKNQDQHQDLCCNGKTKIAIISEYAYKSDGLLYQQYDKYLEVIIIPKSLPNADIETVVRAYEHIVNKLEKKGVKYFLNNTTSTIFKAWLLGDYLDYSDHECKGKTAYVRHPNIIICASNNGIFGGPNNNDINGVISLVPNLYRFTDVIAGNETSETIGLRYNSYFPNGKVDVIYAWTDSGNNIGSYFNNLLNKVAIEQTCEIVNINVNIVSDPNEVFFNGIAENIVGNPNTLDSGIRQLYHDLFLTNKNIVFAFGVTDGFQSENTIFNTKLFVNGFLATYWELFNIATANNLQNRLILDGLNFSWSKPVNNNGVPILNKEGIPYPALTLALTDGNSGFVSYNKLFETVYNFPINDQFRVTPEGKDYVLPFTGTSPLGLSEAIFFLSLQTSTERLQFTGTQDQFFGFDELRNRIALYLISHILPANDWTYQVDVRRQNSRSFNLNNYVVHPIYYQ
jgi:hypothetical protein